MKATFKVTNTFTLEGRRHFIIAGQVCEGTVRKGMLVNVPLNAAISISLEIASIEFVRYSDREDVALCVSFQDRDELALLKGLNISDEVLDIVEKS